MTEDLAATYGLKEAKGAVVGSVTPGSPAEKAGLQPEDVVLSADGHAIEDNGDLSRYIAAKTPGTTVRLELLRGKDREDGQRHARHLPRRGERRAVEPTTPAVRSSAWRSATSRPQMAERLNLPRGHPGRRGHGRRGRRGRGRRGPRRGAT